ncbi:MAG TPA: hypothetical protein PLB48_07920 [Treponema sp.]|nr:hypothetical protein [Treponema sp.]HRS03635.1 hypothetical protein [Treponema sp.]HRU28045.1 hypothetical protein [Treponema sp.]
MRLRKYVILPISLLLLPALLSFSAELTVPSLEMASTGTVQNGSFSLSSVAQADIALTGGYKYGGLLRLAFSSRDLEKALGYGRTSLDPASSNPVPAADYNALVDRFNNLAALQFKLAQVSARKPFDLPVELSYFIGFSDSFCSGDDFPQLFGSVPVNSEFKGFAYFPQGIGGNPAYQYNGIHQAIGTGFHLSLLAWQNFIPMVYLYQDSAFINESTGIPESGRYSGDVRFLVNSQYVKFEAFAGATYPYGTYGMYRGGMLAYFTTGTGADFLAQAGIPGWESGTDLKVDNLYFLFEPRLAIGIFALHITLFYHPVRYLQLLNPEERGATDINAKLLIGDILKYRLQGGLESTVNLRSGASVNTLDLRVSPFVSVITEGIRWDFKIRIDPFKYTKPLEMADTFIGVRTAY